MRRFLLGTFLDVIGIMIIIMSFLFPFHFFMPAWSHTETTLHVEPYGNSSLDLDLFMGGIIRGTVQVIGAENNTALDFTIEDSAAETVTSRRIQNGYNFEFSPKTTGLHKLHFDNTINAREPKSVNVTIRQYYYNILLLCIGFAVFISGIVLIITAAE